MARMAKPAAPKTTITKQPFNKTILTAILFHFIYIFLQINKKRAGLLGTGPALFLYCNLL